MNQWLLIGYLCFWLQPLSAEVDFTLQRTIKSSDGRKNLEVIIQGYDTKREILHVKTTDHTHKEYQLAFKTISVADRLFVLDHKQQLSEMFRLMKIPTILKARFSKKTRAAMIKRHQFAAGSEAALDKFLHWLKINQRPDGSWLDRHKVSMTSMSLLVYFGRGETPDSLQYGDTIRGAINYLIKVAEMQKGRLAQDLKNKHWPYEHALATMALAEAQTICSALGIEIPKLKTVTQVAGDWILKHQHQSGAWEYGYDMSGRRGGDTSIALWHIQALKACEHTGLWKEKAFKGVIRKALDYLGKMQNSNGGMGYSSPSAHGEVGFTMTGGGMLAHQMWGKPQSAFVRKGARYIRKNTKFNYNTQHADLYKHYYNSLAMIHRGGNDWFYYNSLLGKQLIDNQEASGVWKNVGGGTRVNAVAAAFYGDSPFNQHYRSCLCAMILQVPYRYQLLPLATQKGAKPGQPFGK